MKAPRIILFCFAVIVAQQAAAQRLTLYKTFGGVIFMLNDSVQLSTKQAGTLMFQNQQAHEEFRKARSRATISSVLGFTGAAMIAVPLVTTALGEEGGGGWLVEVQRC